MQIDIKKLEMLFWNDCYPFAAAVLDLPDEPEFDLFLHEGENPKLKNSLATFSAWRRPEIRIAYIEENPITTTVISFFHELVHYAQWVHQYNRNWAAMVKTLKAYDYMNNPLEIEARDGEKKLYTAFMSLLD